MEAVGLVVVAIFAVALVPGFSTTMRRSKPFRRAKHRYRKWRARRDRDYMRRPTPEFEPLHKRRPVRHRVRRARRKVMHPKRAVRHWWRRRPYRRH